MGSAVVNLPTADAAESEFYRAFSAGDLEGMLRVWADGEGIVCVHPAQETLVGRASVAESWREILEPASGFDIVYQCIARYESGDLAMHIGVEQLRVDDDEVASLTVTNGYRRTQQGWRIFYHQAAPIHTARGPAGPVH
jgi:ketosteroid isomerase-like protein